MVDKMRDLKSLAQAAENKARPFFDKIDETAFYNTEKVMAAFEKYRVCLLYTSPSPRDA